MSEAAAKLEGWAREAVAGCAVDDARRALDGLEAVAGELGARTEVAKLAKAVVAHLNRVAAVAGEPLRKGASPFALKQTLYFRGVRAGISFDSAVERSVEVAALVRGLVRGTDHAGRAEGLLGALAAGLVALAKAQHPGLALLPSKKDPKVLRWQKITQVNASDSPGAGSRVALATDWDERDRQGLTDVDDLLDAGMERATGKAEDVAHHHGVGGYEGKSEPTSLSEYKDENGEVFQKGLGACAAVGLRHEQLEVFLSAAIPQLEADDRGASFEAAAELAKATPDAWDPTPSMDVVFQETPEELLGRIQSWSDGAGGGSVPGFTITEGADGGSEARFILFSAENNKLVGSLLGDLLFEQEEPQVRIGWAVTRPTGSSDSMEAALEDHRDKLRQHGYTKKEIAAQEPRRS